MTDTSISTTSTDCIQRVRDISPVASALIDCAFAAKAICNNANFDTLFTALQSEVSYVERNNLREKIDKLERVKELLSD